MAERKVTFYLYRITAPAGKSVQRDLFTPVLNINLLQDRHRNIDAERITLWDAKVDNLGWVFGQVFRSRTDDIEEFLAGRSGSTRSIPLNQFDEEGLTGRTHFLYVPGYDILVLQSGQRRVGPGLFVRYLCKVAGIDDVEIRPVVTKSQYEKFRRMNVIGSIVISFEKPDRGTPLRGSRDSTSAILQEAAKVGAMNVYVKFGRGRSRKDSLHARGVQGVVDDMLSAATAQDIALSSVYVKGAPTIDDKLDEIDLIQHRMKHTVSNMPCDQYGPSTEGCYAACREAYLKFQEEIEELYRRRD
ncbi:MAG: DUF6731 family protein [Bacteroidota bacterium]